MAHGLGALAHCLAAERQARPRRSSLDDPARADGGSPEIPVAHVTDVQSAGRQVVPHQAVPQAMSLPTADGIWEWRDYAHIKTQRETARRRRIERLSTAPIDMVWVDRRSIADAAARLSFPAVDTPLVSILIPVFNHITLTLECLTTIERHTRDVSYEIIVADDASSDETGEIIAGLANVRHVRQRENLNFLRNCNTSSKWARGRYLVILNNDAQVTPGWLAALVTAFESEANVGAVGPKFVYPNGRLQEAGAGLNLDGTSKMIGLFDDPDLPRYNYRREVDYCSGACLMVETARFHDMGGFAEAFAPAYSEDSELCLRLRQAGLKILYEPASKVVHHLSKTTAAIDESFKMRAAAVNQQKLVTRWQETIDRLNDVRLLAFYLPQFHPIPENDRWWGGGFTEWRNVSKAFPNYVGHYQPRRPAELGYYDLRLPDVMEAQAALARRYGIAGFCYYYYWFAGQRLLERPLEQMLTLGRPDLPFCLCWANENWTRRWDGENHNVLIGQKHSPEDDIAVITDLCRYFRSPNYIRIGGRPLLLVYRVKLFPDFRATVDRWRRHCRENGIGEIYVATVEAFDQVANLESPERWGCDAGVEFPPHGFGNARKPSAQILNPRYEGTTDDYVELVHRYLDRPVPGYRRFRGVMAGWDNTPRRQNNSLVFENATPGAFQAWLEAAVAETREQAHGDERIVFINAWNEWAEGAYLEPDARFGHTWLEAVRNSHDAQRMVKG
jgi:GT2 family glycosyltransferase